MSFDRQVRGGATNRAGHGRLIRPHLCFFSHETSPAFSALVFGSSFYNGCHSFPSPTNSSNGLPKKNLFFLGPGNPDPACPRRLLGTWITPLRRLSHATGAALRRLSQAFIGAPLMIWCISWRRMIFFPVSSTMCIPTVAHWISRLRWSSAVEVRGLALRALEPPHVMLRSAHRGPVGHRVHPWSGGFDQRVLSLIRRHRVVLSLHWLRRRDVRLRVIHPQGGGSKWR
mmetsp:Transcript_23039/g.53859  ORF Transcript_23039/g.53859 Transcript_23039/m.53859 type:complete len:228 (-) Transcript_23039:130-813(-)|eukprot:CAMPEP_0114550400 /NCGR_PEP_ID=MMETSP0114-20121206/6055_1 /TAXON_ID=31324 /ORGANISM="Goniomonas sp, Strain m" /LENGTH=227 /DNA_ID=CAMNT_0001735175 /DNA_START=221 /DNA_END=904 /DNA_ORIENTATION=+